MMDNNWRKEIPIAMNNACRGCRVCDGVVCRGEVPGMGGVGLGKTFQSNYLSWENVQVDYSAAELPLVAVAPMTGVDENMGAVFEEKQFHQYVARGANKSNILHCIGDGTPDYKIITGAEALKNESIKGAAFIKPYLNHKIFERYEWIKDTIDFVGVDIDSYLIKTMAGKVELERKNVEQLLELKKSFEHPIIIKGVSSVEDIELVENVKPDIVVISNHGGRLLDNQEGIAYFAKKNIAAIRNYCSEIWIDGGLRKKMHLLKASALGIKRVLIGRPFIQGVAVYKENGIEKVLNNIFSS